MKAKITPKLAELAGLHAGDGSMYLTTRGIVWELRGSLEEKEFYDKYVKFFLKIFFSRGFNLRNEVGVKMVAMACELQTINQYHICAQLDLRQVIKHIQCKYLQLYVFLIE